MLFYNLDIFIMLFFQLGINNNYIYIYIVIYQWQSFIFIYICINFYLIICTILFYMLPSSNFILRLSNKIIFPNDLFICLISCMEIFYLNCQPVLGDQIEVLDLDIWKPIFEFIVILIQDSLLDRFYIRYFYVNLEITIIK